MLILIEAEVPHHMWIITGHVIDLDHEINQIGTDRNLEIVIADPTDLTETTITVNTVVAIIVD